MSQTKIEKKGTPIIQDRAVIAVSIEGNPVVGEAYSVEDDIQTQLMTATERKEMITRLETCINELIDEAEKAHEAKCYIRFANEI